MIKAKYIMLLLFFVSCTKEISIDLDGHESKLVVNSFFAPSDSIMVHVSKSIPILSTDSLRFVNEAVVDLYQDGTFIASAIHTEKGFYTLPGPLQSQQEYNISVSIAGMETVSAIDTIPSLVPIINFDTISIDEKYLYCELEFQDLPEESNYYLLDVLAEKPILNEDSVLSKQVEIYVSDIAVENGGNGDVCEYIYFSDALMDGETYYLAFVLDKEQILSSEQSNQIFIHFKMISKNYYTYLQTYRASQYTQMDVFSNVENGYGIFAGYNVSSNSILLVKP